MIKIGSTLTTQKRLSLMEHLLYRLRLRRGGLFLIQTPEQNGRSFLMSYLDKNLSVHEMVFSATPASKNLLPWLGRFFKLSSPSVEDIKRELEPIYLSGRHIIILIERLSYFESDWVKDLETLVEKIPFAKIVISGTRKELHRLLKHKKLENAVLSRENWPVFSFASSMTFLETLFSALPFLSRFLIAFTSHGRPGVLKKLAEHVSIFKTQKTRRTLQVILKNYALTFPFFPRNLGFILGLAFAGMLGYFAFHPLMEKLKEHRLERARAVLEETILPVEEINQIPERTNYEN